MNKCKSFLFLLLSFSFSSLNASPALRRLPVGLEGYWIVENLDCLSGEPVNASETVPMGSEVYIDKDDYSEGELSYVNGTLITLHPITHGSEEYASGRPPCEPGDRLIIYFKRGRR